MSALGILETVNKSLTERQRWQAASTLAEREFRIKRNTVCHHIINIFETAAQDGMQTSIDFIYRMVLWWRHFPRYWPFVRGIHRSPMNSPHNGQWRGALMFSLIRVWINGWVNNRNAGDKRRYRAHYDVIVMIAWIRFPHYYPFLSGIYWSLVVSSNIRQVMQNFDVFFALNLSWLLNKQSSYKWLQLHKTDMTSL